MSENGQEEPPPEPERLREPTAASLRLRSERPRVTRLSRKVLAGGAAVAALVGIQRHVAAGISDQETLRSLTAALLQLEAAESAIYTQVSAMPISRIVPRATTSRPQ